MVNKYTAPGVRNTIWCTLICFNFATHFSPPKKSCNTFLSPPLQLFMCVLWFLLQLAVIFMYWDLPPLERGKAKESLTSHSTDVENDKGLVEEDNDEEKPLMGSQELVGSYGSVVTSSPPIHHTPTESDATPNHISPPSPVPPDSHKSSSPCKNFCLSRGEWLTACVSVILVFIKSLKVF